MSDPKRNKDGKIVINPNDPQDVRWLHKQQGQRGAKAVNKGKEKGAQFIGTVLGLPLAGTLGSFIGLGGIGTISDIASVISNPMDPLNYIGASQAKKGFDFLKQAIHPKISYISPIKEASKEASKTADFTKAQSNIQVLDKMDEFAEQYGYPLSDRSTIFSNRKTNKQVRDLIARHNTYLRGVRPYGFESDDVQNVKNLLGGNISDEDFMKYAATHSRPNQRGIWISPAENAFNYGGYGETALVRRKYNLGKDRNRWFEERDFKIQTNPVLEEKTWNNMTGIIAPWYTPSGKGLVESELLSMDNLNFAGWANPNSWRNRVSLNNKVRKKGGKL